MNVSMGIDIGKKKCDYCVINGGGRVLDSGQTPYESRDEGLYQAKLAKLQRRLQK